MRTNTRHWAIALISGCVLGSMGCNLPGSTSAASADPAATGSGGTFTASDVIKSWSTGCIAASEPITSSDHYLATLNLVVGGHFSYSQAWYVGTCTPSNYSVILNSSGTYTVGGVISASSSLQSIQFTVTASDLMPMTNTAYQTDFLNDCGNTSGFQAAGSGGSGVAAGNYGNHFSTYMYNCMHATFPNSGNDIVNNVAGFSSGVLTLGTPAEGIPGVFSGATVPTTTSLTFN